MSINTHPSIRIQKIQFILSLHPLAPLADMVLAYDVLKSVKAFLWQCQDHGVGVVELKVEDSGGDLPVIIGAKMTLHEHHLDLNC